MPFHGSIVVIKRSGTDGSIFPLVNDSCLLGRAEGCDIRVQLPTVSKEHCKITVNENQQVRASGHALRLTSPNSWCQI
ncbi:MAG: FHA domain-containing protein [Pseudomonadota bacterium]